MLSFQLLVQWENKKESLAGAVPYGLWYRYFKTFNPHEIGLTFWIKLGKTPALHATAKRGGRLLLGTFPHDRTKYTTNEIRINPHRQLWYDIVTNIVASAREQK